MYLKVLNFINIRQSFTGFVRCVKCEFYFSNVSGKQRERQGEDSETQSFWKWKMQLNLQNILYITVTDGKIALAEGRLWLGNIAI